MINWLVPLRETNDSLTNRHERCQALLHGFTLPCITSLLMESAEYINSSINLLTAVPGSGFIYSVHSRPYIRQYIPLFSYTASDP